MVPVYHQPPCLWIKNNLAHRFCVSTCLRGLCAFSARVELPIEPGVALRFIGGVGVFSHVRLHFGFVLRRSVAR